MFLPQRAPLVSRTPITATWLTHSPAARQFGSFTAGFQELLHLERRHATGSGSGDRLPIAAVLHVPAGKNSGYAREDVVAGNEIPVLVGVELAVKHGGVGNVTDPEEHGAHRQVP